MKNAHCGLLGAAGFLKKDIKETHEGV